MARDFFWCLAICALLPVSCRFNAFIKLMAINPQPPVTPTTKLDIPILVMTGGTIHSRVRLPCFMSPPPPPLPPPSQVSPNVV
ncbi:hypothetical protein C8J57DRAFT_1714432 [Mycena rebaudengoi]|nr:hypothetical protein C8J57DRAFT_1714432 [Mycena rebaudengoi]